MLNFSKIFIPTRPQTDTIIAIFLLKKFGNKKFPGILDAEIICAPTLPANENEKTLLEKGILCIDIGGGDFDHHNKIEKTTSSNLIAKELGIEDDKSITKMLMLAERCDFYGKGTISEDALDRAFGLSGMIVTLNKTYSSAPEKVVKIILPLLEAHYQEELKRNYLLPELFNKQLADGTAEEFTIKQKDKNLKVVIVESDDSSMSGFLRSVGGGRHDVVAQWSEKGYLNITTRPTKRPNLSKLTATIRKAELLIKGDNLDYSYQDLSKVGKIKEVEQWYYDTATNSLLNGSTNPGDTTKTNIERRKLRQILEIGLTI